MKDTRILMGMPIEVEIVGDTEEVRAALEDTFAYFAAVEEQFSPFKDTSEVAKMNRGEVTEETMSDEMREVLAIAGRMKAETKGYFDVRRPDGTFNPSGVVKGWAIKNAAKRIREQGLEHYMVNAGGDIAVGGKDANGEEWSIGIRSPFNLHEIVKVVYPHGKGVATSGSYIRGAHIYDPHDAAQKLEDVVSVTVISFDVLEADLYATAAFAMGKDGIRFLENTPGVEGYAIDKDGIATMTTGWGAYTTESSI